jgi:hypothetical protein
MHKEWVGGIGIRNSESLYMYICTYICTYVCICIQVFHFIHNKPVNPYTGCATRQPRCTAIIFHYIASYRIVSHSMYASKHSPLTPSTPSAASPDSARKSTRRCVQTEPKATYPEAWWLVVHCKAVCSIRIWCDICIYTYIHIHNHKNDDEIKQGISQYSSHSDLMIS